MLNYKTFVKTLIMYKIQKHMSKFSEILKSPTILSIIDNYETVIGLKAVRAAQESVIKAEEKFLSVQENRKDIQLELVNVQARRRELSSELDKVQRGDNRFISLITEEHKVIQSEKDFLAKLHLIEKSERDHFMQLSSRLRESHEKERAQSERTKYWSIAGSMTGAMLGLVGASINNYRRNRYLTQLVEKTVGQMKDVSNLAGVLSKEQSQLAALLEKSSPGSEAIKESSDTLLKELRVNQKALSALYQSIISVSNEFDEDVVVIADKKGLVDELHSLNISNDNNFKLLCCVTALTAGTLLFNLIQSSSN